MLSESVEKSRRKLIVSGDLLIITGNLGGGRKGGRCSKVDEVSRLSVSSRRRMAKYLRECVSDYRVMITLTYSSTMDVKGQTSKKHLGRFCRRYMSYVMRKYSVLACQVSIFWFMEFQSNGQVHYHAFGTHVVPYKRIAEMWMESTQSDDYRMAGAATRIEAFRGGKKGISRYAAKYAAKQEQKVVPDGFGNPGRFWGVYGNRETMAAAITIDESTKQKKYLDDLVTRIRERVRAGARDGSCRRIVLDCAPVTMFAIKNQAFKLGLNLLFDEYNEIYFTLEELKAMRKEYVDEETNMFGDVLTELEF